MLREEFVKRINDEWEHRVFNNRYVTRKYFSGADSGLFFAKKDEESDIDYYCYAGIDKHGRPYVHVYDDIDECWNKEDSYNPIDVFFSRSIQKIKDKVFDIKCYFQRAKNGYCEKDLYSISYWFLNTLPKMLRELKTKPSYVPVDDAGEFLYPYNKDNIKIPFIYTDNGYGLECIIDTNDGNGFVGKLDFNRAGKFSFAYDFEKKKLHLMSKGNASIKLYIHDDNSYTIDYDDNNIKKDDMDMLVEFFNKALIEYQNKTEGSCVGSAENWFQILEKIAELFDRAKYDDCDANPYDIIKDKEKYDNHEANLHHYKAMKLKEGFELFTKYFRRLGW